MGQHEKALMLHTECAVIFEALGDLGSRMFAVRGIEECLASQGDLAKAIQQHTKHLALSQQLDDVKHQAQAALNMGVALWTQGLAEHHAAIATADEGLQPRM